LLYIHLFYPLMMICVGFLREPKMMVNQLDKKRWTDNLPKITLLIAAYNEEDSIEKKILNSLQLNYPSDLLEIIIFSDGSTDRTDTIVGEYREDQVILLRYEGRRGKTACQNMAVKNALGDIIVYSDATSLLSRDSLLHVANRFGEKKVGCVVGKLCSSLDSNQIGIAAEETLFLKFSQWVKKLESLASMPVGGSGALFAIRSDLVRELPADANDDLLRPLSVVFQGYTIVYDEEASAFEILQQSYHDILRKKIRIAERAVYSMRLSSEILNPFKYGLFSLQFLTKVLLRRLVLPVLIIYIVTGAAIYYITGSYLFLLLLCGPALIFLLAVNGAIRIKIFRGAGGFISRMSKFCYYYLLSNTGAFIGLLRGIRGKKVKNWERTTGGS